MRPVILILTLLVVSPAWADEPRDAAEDNPAEVQAVDLQPEALTHVMVLPFTSIGQDSAQPWMSSAIQQSVLVDVGRVKGVRLVTAPADADLPDALDLQAALALAREAGADVVVVGSFQMAEPTLRITGFVLDASSGQTLTTLKATGAVRDLFGLQDAVGAQAARALRKTEPLPEGPPIVVPAPPEAAPRPAPGTIYRDSQLRYDIHSRRISRDQRIAQHNAVFDGAVVRPVRRYYAYGPYCSFAIYSAYYPVVRTAPGVRPADPREPVTFTVRPIEARQIDPPARAEPLRDQPGE